MIVIFGVSGCGKTTIGKALANQLQLPFYDADHFHPEANIKKMSNGLPLNDDDRLPWLTILSEKIEDWSKNGNAVLACSALKERYRLQLASKGTQITWVYLNGTFKCIENRLQNRTDHFMKAELLKSQFDALEVPDYGIHVNIDATPEHIINSIIKKLNA